MFLMAYCGSLYGSSVLQALPGSNHARPSQMDQAKFIKYGKHKAALGASIPPAKTLSSWAWTDSGSLELLLS